MTSTKTSVVAVVGDEVELAEAGPVVAGEDLEAEASKCSAACSSPGGRAGAGRRSWPRRYGRCLRTARVTSLCAAVPIDRSRCARWSSGWVSIASERLGTLAPAGPHAGALRRGRRGRRSHRQARGRRHRRGAETPARRTVPDARRRRAGRATSTAARSSATWRGVPRRRTAAGWATPTVGASVVRASAEQAPVASVATPSAVPTRRGAREVDAGTPREAAATARAAGTPSTGTTCRCSGETPSLAIAARCSGVE